VVWALNSLFRFYISFLRRIIYGSGSLKIALFCKGAFFLLLLDILAMNSHLSNRGNDASGAACLLKVPRLITLLIQEGECNDTS